MIAMATAEQELEALALNYLRPREARDIVEWCRQNIVLVDKANAFSGPWSDANCPYVREPLRAMVDAGVETVVLEWASQLFKTTLLIGFTCFIIENDPGPLLWVMNNDRMARNFNQKRFEPTIEASEVLSAFKPENPDNYKLLEKSFTTCDLKFTGANSAGNLASDPFRYLIGDELNKWPQIIRSEAGALDLARQRTRSFPNFKHILTSTPTVPEGAITQEYLRGTQERFYVPSPFTGEFFTMMFVGLRWDQGSRRKSGNWDLAKVEETAHYVCPFSGQPFGEEERARILQLGEWRAKSPREPEDPPLRPRCRSFRLNVFNSLHANCTFARIAREHLEAGRDPSKRQNFTNAWLAEPSEEEAEAVAADPLWERRELYTDDGKLPRGVCVLVAGVDCQQGDGEMAERLEYEIVGVGVGEETWGIEYGVIYGSLTQPEIWKKLDEVLQRKWEHPCGKKMGVFGAGVDSGFETEAVYDFVEPRAYRNVFALKGVQGQEGQPLVSLPRKTTVARVVIYIVSRYAGNKYVFARLRIDEHGPSFCHFPRLPNYAPAAGYDQEYFSQLTNEKLRAKYVRGRKIGVYVKTGRNEALAARRYAMATLAILNLDLPAWSRQVEEALEKGKQSPRSGTEATKPGQSGTATGNPRRAKEFGGRLKPGGFVGNY
jgi:phage terminase large subunit GpA-like protein